MKADIRRLTDLAGGAVVGPHTHPAVDVVAAAGEASTAQNAKVLKAPAGVGAATFATLKLHELSGVDVTSAITGDRLGYDGSAWVPYATSGDGASTNAATSVDSEVALFSGTTGKLLKRATATGIAKLTAGVQGVATAGTDYYAPAGLDVPLADGGTGASTAAVARTNLGLVIGTDVQAQDAELAAIAELVSAADRLPYFTGVGTASLATFTAAGRALVDDADAAAQRITLGAAATVHTHAGADIDTGTVATARLGSGTASAATYLRGDGAWTLGPVQRITMFGGGNATATNVPGSASEAALGATRTIVDLATCTEMRLIVCVSLGTAGTGVIRLQGNTLNTFLGTNTQMLAADVSIATTGTFDSGWQTLPVSMRNDGQNIRVVTFSGNATEDGTIGTVRVEFR